MRPPGTRPGYDGCAASASAAEVDHDPVVIAETWLASGFGDPASSEIIRALLAEIASLGGAVESAEKNQDIWFEIAQENAQRVAQWRELAQRAQKTPEAERD